MKFVQDELKKRLSCIRAGDTITVYYEIKEGEKTRTQFLKELLFKEEVLVTQKLYNCKMSGSVGVERIFPVNLPPLQKS
jgi:large subunit ribosomal protein L19